MKPLWTNLLRPLGLASLATLALTTAALAQQTYKVGSTPTGVPFTFMDIKTQQIQGAMVDLITAIGDEPGLQGHGRRRRRSLR